MLPDGMRRNYEVSIWTLQDSFITVLKPANLEFKGQIQDPNISIKDDGTLQFNCSIPMYLWQDDKFIENPIWYTTKDGTIIADMRKLKVIFNKRQINQKILEFVITKVTESHDKKQLICKIESEGLAFHELGHKGIKLVLSLQDFLNDYNDWMNGSYMNDAARAAAEPHNNINYWNNKIFTEDFDWSYEVCMDWSAYVGEGRATDKVYENAYVSDWQLDANENKLISSQYQTHQEKYRIVDISNSNFYNITQKIAEIFGVYCKYEYEYDADYHIIGKKVIYYNNFIEESYGALDITYPYETDKISRIMDGTDICTKLYVENLEDTSTASGLISIMNSKANKSKENYILNFDYLYKIGAITEDQYNSISDYELQMHQYNEIVSSISEQILQLEQELPIQEATVTLKTENIALDQEQMAEAQRMLDNLTNDGEMYVTAARPYRGILIATYVNLPTNIGIIPGTVHIYTEANCNSNTEYNGNVDYTIQDGAVVRVNNLPGGQVYYYFTYTYDPRLPYQTVYNTFMRRLDADRRAKETAEARVSVINTQLTSLRATLNEQLTEQARVRDKFSAMMGPALREGSWRPESYDDYGEQHEEAIEILWDHQPFDGEQLIYEVSDIDETKSSYLFIRLDKKIDGEKTIVDWIKEKNAWNDLICEYEYDSLQSNNRITGTSVINSSMFFVYTSEYGEPCPSLLLTNVTTQDISFITTISGTVVTNLRSLTLKVQNFLGTISGSSQLITDSLSLNELNFAESPDLDTKMRYPRLKINSPALKIGEDILRVQQKVSNDNNSTKYQDLTMYEDYSVLFRDDSYYLTLDSKQLLQYTTTFRVSYQLSNADTEIYLDAREVSQTNAYPKVSYDVAVSLLQNDLWKALYSKIGYIVNINDDELKFENVQGYISEINMKLDKPWEDSIKIKNYKTKFEDLFSQIVASSNIVQANVAVYDRTVSLFNADGTIKQTVIQTTLNKMDLDYSFRNGTLTIDDVKGIWGASDDGVVAFTGGGIFTATEKDESGNWRWNTGIVPSGINASLINAGQLDTNLIRIFAGDNLRFQMNGQGLYAFRADESGKANLNQYVVYDEDGLRLHTTYNTIVDEEEITNEVDRVKISWDGLTLYDNTGTATLSANAETGNLTVRGAIEATSLQIIGGTAQSSFISNLGLATQTDLSNISIDTTDLVRSNLSTTINYQSNNNVVTLNQNGLTITQGTSTFTANSSSMGFFQNDTLKLGYSTGLNAFFLDGTIYATNGRIGSGNSYWNIGSGSIYNGIQNFGNSGSTSGGMYLGTDGISVNNIITLSKQGEFSIYDNYTISHSKIFSVESVGGRNQLVLNNTTIQGNPFPEGFILPIENGGTGSNSASIPNIYKVIDSSSSLPLNALNGSLGIVYSTGTSGNTSSNNSIQAANFTPTPNTANADQQQYRVSSTPITSNKDQSWFGRIASWNFSRLTSSITQNSITYDGWSGDADKWARVGRHNDTNGSRAGLYIKVPSSLNLITGSLTSIQIQFKITGIPYTATNALPSSVNNSGAINGNGIVAIYKEQNDSTALGYNTYTFSDLTHGSSSRVTKNVTITLNDALGSSDTFYIVFYANNGNSIHFVNEVAIIQATNSSSGNNTVKGELWLYTGGSWRQVGQLMN